ncbi:MAG: transglycosylase SLT domain-containing protein, partial [Bdellovibrionota bacterium]
MVWSCPVYLAYLTVAIGILSSCAGPYNAVGPDSPFQRGPTFSPQQISATNNNVDLFLVQKDETSFMRSPAHLSSARADLSFTPGKMLFNSETPLVITVKSTTPLSKNYEIIASLNGQDISHQANRVTANSHVVSLYFDSSYFQKKRDYTFAVFFRNSAHDPWSHAILEEASCSLMAQYPFYFPKEKSGKYSILSHIEMISRQNNINPSLVYGLINQESSFNPRAFSPNMAVGLTQMTLRAARQVDMAGPEWPIYEGLESMPFFEGKFLIETGQIHGDMDWRLGPEKSIEGGVAYLRYLRDFWSKYLDHDSRFSNIKRLNLDKEKSMCNLVLA